MIKKLLLLSLFSAPLAHPQEDHLSIEQTRKIADILSKIESYFHKPPLLVGGVLLPMPPQLWDANVLSPFQLLFRETISFTHKTNNILCTIAEKVMEETKEHYYTVEQATERFIEEIQRGGAHLINEALLETLDVDLNKVIPHFLRIKDYTASIHHTINGFAQLQLFPQVHELLRFVKTIQEKTSFIQKEGLIALSSQLAANALFDTPSQLVDAFNDLYAAYPIAMEKIKTLQIKQTGVQAHAVFNSASELLEQVVLLHTAAGKLGHIFIHTDLITLLDGFKNQVRKLGNALEFVTSTESHVVIAPPTTSDAMVEIIETYLWQDGATLRLLLIEKIDDAKRIIQKIKLQVPLCKSDMELLHEAMQQFSPHIHTQFVQQLKSSPLINIPQCPVILLELLEEQVSIIKEQLNTLIVDTVKLIDHLCDLLSCSAQMLTYADTFMGGSQEHPFIHPDIIRGIGFVIEDAQDLCVLAHNLIAEIDACTVRY